MTGAIGRPFGTSAVVVWLRRAAVLITLAGVVAIQFDSQRGLLRTVVAGLFGDLYALADKGWRIPYEVAAIGLSIAAVAAAVLLLVSRRRRSAAALVVVDAGLLVTEWLESIAERSHVIRPDLTMVWIAVVMLAAALVAFALPWRSPPTADP